MKKAGAGRAAVIILITAAAVFAAGMLFTSYYMSREFRRASYPDRRLTAEWYYEDYAADHPREEVSFMSGRNRLKGWIYGAENTRGLVVFAHGIGCGHEDYINLIMELADDGWKVFAYDATGSCESEGRSTRGLVQSALDLDCALTFAENDGRLSGLPLYVAGHSWGGYAAAAVLNFDHDIRAVVSMSGYNSAFEETADTADVMFGPASVLTYPFIKIYNAALFGKYAGLTAVDGINSSDIPVLIVHGSDDTRVRYDSAAVTAHRDSITNSRAEYYTFSEPYMNTHSGFFLSPEYIEYYQKEIKAEEDRLHEKYGHNCPEDELERFYSMIDGELYNRTNPELVKIITEFFGKY